MEYKGYRIEGSYGAGWSVLDGFREVFHSRFDDDCRRWIDAGIDGNW